ncbi:hypothetical protein FRB94_010547 [Tulasnella sp. JGI-2019a]|nr:hypothetical protein FRB94_010547 [Tulasnella sp. JGI-2019a]KAG9017901.1 hypothetical protein FRB93_004712 [Tulasnella sp. JGI-2019a]KAG9039076.1 hypothetical protein FRB95_012787 [Tulasnella sp. JGI-2019a]
MAATFAESQQITSEKKEKEIESFVPRRALYDAALVGAQSAAVGVVISAVQNALAKHNAGAAGIFTRTGGTIGFFAAMGATFAFTDSMSANIREKDDATNGFVGGCSAGVLAGLRSRSLPTAVMACGVMGGLVAAFDATGRSLTGGHDQKETSEDREERRRRFFKKPPPFGNQMPSSESKETAES